MPGEVAADNREIALEAALKLSAQRFADIVAAVSDWVWETDETLALRYVSGRFTETTGLPEEAVLGRTLPALVFSDESAGTGQDRTFGEHSILPFRDLAWTLADAQDKPHHFALSGMPFYDVDGKFAGFRGAARDITPEIEARRRYTVVRLQVEDTINALSDGVVVYDGDGRIVFCNEAYRSCYPDVSDVIKPGTHIEEVLRTVAERRRVAEDAGERETWVNRRLRERLNPRDRIEEHYINGRWWRIHEYRRADGSVVSQRRDISREKMAEIRKAKQGPSDETVSDGFVVYDDEGRIVSVSPGYDSLYPLAGDLLVPGGRLEDALREAAATGKVPEAVGRVEEWVREKVEERLNPTGDPLERFIDGRWWRIAEQRTLDGRVVSVRTDITALKEMSIKMAGLQSLLADVVEGLQEGFALYDAEDRLMLCNGRYREMANVPARLLVPGTPFEEILRASARKLFANRSDLHRERWIRARLNHHRNPTEPLEVEGDGERWLQVHAKKTEDGHTVRVLYDITPLRARERALRESELRATAAQRRLLTAIETISDGFLLCDPEDRLVLCNHKYREIAREAIDVLVPGQTYETIVRTIALRRFPDYTDRERERWVAARLEVHRNPGEPIEMKRPDGRWIRFSDFRSADGGYVELRTDITSLKEAEAAVLQREARLRSIMDTVLDGIVVIDERGLIESFNAAAENIFGYPAKEVVGKNVNILMPEPDSSQHDAYLKRYLRTGERRIIGYGREVAGRRRDNSLFPLEIEVSELKWEGRSLFIGVCRDITALKHAQAALIARENRLRGIMDTVVDGIITTDINGIIDSFNPAAEKIFGYAAAEVVGRNVSMLMPEPQRSQHDRYIRDYLRTGHAKVIGFGREMVGQRRNGTLFPIELAVSELRRDSSSIFIGAVRDITQRKAAEKALRESEERYALAMHGTNEGIWDWDIANDRIYISPRLQAILGIESRSTLSARGWCRYIHPDDRQQFLERLSEHLRGRTDFFICEVRLANSGDPPRWLRDRGVALRDEQGRAYRMAGSIADVTERRQAIEALRESEERYALALQGTAEGIWDWDIKQDKVYISPRLQTLLGIEGRSTMSARAWLRYIHPEDRAMFRDRVVEHFKGKTDYFFCEFRLAGPPETGVRWLGDRGVALRDESGRAYRMSGSIGEITERKRSEAVLREAKEIAELASRAKTEFLANMSHELRTPLNAIIGFSDIMRLGIFGDLGAPQYSEYMRAIRDSGQHLLDIINDILDVSRIEAGRLDLEPENVDVRSTIDACLRLIRERAEAADVALHRRIQKDLPPLWAELRRFKQILLNLLSNAVKFTPQGGRITVSARIDGKGGLRIAVADTGIGMSKEDMEHAMNPFGQVDSTLARKYEGTGLGLPLTKAFVEMHGGTLHLKSAPGLGTTVTVRFPKNLVLRA